MIKKFKDLLNEGEHSLNDKEQCAADLDILNFRVTGAEKISGGGLRIYGYDSSSEYSYFDIPLELEQLRVYKTGEENDRRHGSY